MPAPKRIKECYFYKEDNKYFIKLKDRKDQFIKETFIYESRIGVNNFIKDLQEGALSKYCCSALGTKIYNKKPHNRQLVMDSKSVYNAFINNLKTFNENGDFYRQKVASILSDVSDLITYDIEACPGSDEIELYEPIDSIVPVSPIDPAVPTHMLDMIEESLNVGISREDCTFIFQKEKFQITKSMYDSEVPYPDSPGTSPSIRSAIDYMITLLGVNADVNKEVGENSFTFILNEEEYKIKHIYTGSGISKTRDDE